MLVLEFVFEFEYVSLFLLAFVFTFVFAYVFVLVFVFVLLYNKQKPSSIPVLCMSLRRQKVPLFQVFQVPPEEYC